MSLVNRAIVRKMNGHPALTISILVASAVAFQLGASDWKKAALTMAGAALLNLGASLGFKKAQEDAGEQ